MLGAIAGDVIGAAYDGTGLKSKEFPLFTPQSHFTDDTVMTVAVAYAILNKVDYVTAFKTFGQKYPDAGYGWYFWIWLNTPTVYPYNIGATGPRCASAPSALRTTRKQLCSGKPNTAPK
jgi:hypothetical protein